MRLRQLLLLTYVFSILATPSLLIYLAFVVVARHPLLRLGVLAAAAPAWLFLYSLTAALLSTATRRAIKAGRFPRTLGHPIYGPRRLYAICWTSIYYFPPLYHLILSFDPWKRLIFRLFGYRGSLRFTIYPDTWVRDLPLLEIGNGAYIANRATLGSNICLRSGDIVVGPIRIGQRATIGHLAVLGLGDTIGDDAEIGVRTTLGVNVTVGAHTVVGAIVGINHGATIGARCRIDSMTYVGKGVHIDDGLHIRFGSVVPDGAHLSSQADAEQCRRVKPDAGPSSIDWERAV